MPVVAKCIIGSEANDESIKTLGQYLSSVKVIPENLNLSLANEDVIHSRHETSNSNDNIV